MALIYYCRVLLIYYLIYFFNTNASYTNNCQMSIKSDFIRLNVSL